MNAAVFDLGMALCSAAIAYLVLALAALWQARGQHRVPPGACEAVSILKPLHGVEPALYENLCSFCRQDYPVFQLLFGVRDATDPALNVAQRVREDFPQLDIGIVVDARLHGRNYKVSNVANLLERADHPWIVIADSDISVGRDYLQCVCAPLVHPEVGVVTCLYRGRALGGRWSRLGGQFIDEWFVPAVRIAQLFGSREFGFGATLALRRDSLDAIGGFHAIANELADDYYLAKRTREAGLATCLSEYVVTTGVGENSPRDLINRELRWMCTIRMLNPLGYAFMIVSFGPAVALIGAALIGWSMIALALLGAVCVARAALHFAVAARGPRWLRRAICALPLVAVRDPLNVILWALAFSRRQVGWAGRALNLS
jgi:ceramide glucosyltransferase